MKVLEFTRSGSSYSMTNLLPGKLSSSIRKYYCTALGCIYSLESSALVGLAPSSLRWFIHTEQWKLKIQTMGIPSR